MLFFVFEELPILSSENLHNCTFMCFHAQQTHSEALVQERFRAKGPVTKGTYNGFAHPELTGLCASTPHQLSLLRWGLIPHWAKEDSILQYTLNARWESMTDKPSFRQAERCLLIADGFFEWQWLDTNGRKKKKYLIGKPGGSLFAFAGLCDQWANPDTGELIRTAAIVTTQAKGIMREIHNSKMRMPVVLSESEESDWLAGSSVRPDIAFEAISI